MVILLIAVVSTLRLSFLSSVSRLLIVNSVLTEFISLFVTLSILLFTLMYYLFDNFSTFEVLYTGTPGDLLVFTYQHQTFLMDQLSLGLHPVSVYYFPFIYIFVLITVLSVLFCLSYNVNELSTFMFYCLVILCAGYTLFFTSSLLVFFLSYEMLLIPSFFILYNFAKTRKCVEAAYLMFFWTQFGALFLIFGFLYLAMAANAHSFEAISLVYLSPYELNFVFFCLLFGFGVKLPI